MFGHSVGRFLCDKIKANTQMQVNIVVSNMALEVLGVLNNMYVCDSNGGKQLIFSLEEDKEIVSR